METLKSRADFPTTSWKELPPQEVGINPVPLLQMQGYIDEYIPGLLSLLIARRGYLVFEQYFQGTTRDDDYYLASATKSVTSALVGIALQQGKLQHLDQTLAEVFPASLLSQVEPHKKEITLRSLLTQTSGLARNGEYTLEFDANKNFVSAALEFPLSEKVFHYNDNGPHILLYLLTLVTQTPIALFAQRHFFQSMGISIGEQWRVTDQGWYPGLIPVGRLCMKSRDILKIGYLFLNGGSWEGRQVVPAQYVIDSTSQHNEGGWPVGVPYGYLWWITQHGPHTAFFAAGLGGQQIYVIPALDLVVVTTASQEQARKHPEQEQEIRALMSRFVLPAILENQ